MEEGARRATMLEIPQVSARHLPGQENRLPRKYRIEKRN